MKQQTPFPRNEGRSCSKAKTHHFLFLDVVRTGGGSKVSIYFVQKSVCNVQYTRRGDCSNYMRANCVQHGGLTSHPPPPFPLTHTHLYVGLFAAFEMWKPNVILSTSFGQLLDMLKFYTGFEINDVTGKNLVYKINVLLSISLFHPLCRLFITVCFPVLVFDELSINAFVS